MLNYQDLLTALHNAAPRVGYETFVKLVDLLSALMNNRLTYEQAQAVVSRDQNLVLAMKELAGKNVSVENSVLSFGDNSQVGDVTVRDMAGRDIVHLTITINQVGTIEQPTTPIILEPQVHKLLDTILEYANHTLTQNQQVLAQVYLEGHSIENIRRELTRLYYVQENWGRFEFWHNSLLGTARKTDNNILRRELMELISLIDTLKEVYYSPNAERHRTIENINQTINEIDKDIKEEEQKAFPNVYNKRKMVQLFERRDLAINELTQQVAQYLQDLRGIVSRIGLLIGTIKGL